MPRSADPAPPLHQRIEQWLHDAGPNIEQPGDVAKELLRRELNAVALLKECQIELTQTAQARDQAERTVRSIAAMLGWGNTPPRETLERDISAIKARLEAAEAMVLAQARHLEELRTLLGPFHTEYARGQAQGSVSSDDAFVQEFKRWLARSPAPTPAPSRHAE